jgi:hypothetical protein
MIPILVFLFLIIQKNKKLYRNNYKIKKELMNMHQVLPDGFQVQPILIWVKNLGKAYHCIVIQTEYDKLRQGAQTDILPYLCGNSNNIWGYVLCSEGFRGKPEQYYIFMSLFSSGSPIRTEHDPFNWGQQSPMFQVHYDLSRNAQALEQVINDQKVVFVFNSTPSGLVPAGRITLQEYLGQ